MGSGQVGPLSRGRLAVGRNSAEGSSIPVGREDAPQGRSVTSRCYGFVARLGALRVFLATLVLACLPTVFFATGEAQGWHAIPSYVAPVLVVLVVWGLLFDMLMARVLMGEQQGHARDHYKTILLVDAILLVALLSFWGPFYVALLS